MDAPTSQSQGAALVHARISVGYVYTIISLLLRTTSQRRPSYGENAAPHPTGGVICVRVGQYKMLVVGSSFL